jgi:hypothetical protein
MTSEQKYNITPQPPESCPIAAEATEAMKRVLGEVEGYARVDSVDVLHDILWRVEYHGSGITKQIEELRRANVAIRDWGEQWKTLAKSLDDELERSIANVEAMRGDDDSQPDQKASSPSREPTC